MIKDLPSAANHFKKVIPLKNSIIGRKLIIMMGFYLVDRIK